MANVPLSESGIWRKSSTSNQQGCVEVALRRGEIMVRDSKDPRGPTLRFTTTEWAAFLTGVRRGEFDLEG